jgi:4'-phosphopantetheinyl transferase
VPAGLEHNQVDLWFVRLAKATGAELHEEYRALLSPEEIGRERRFAVEHARLQFLVGQALVRTALSHYAGTAPRDWIFRRNAYGKPSILAPAAPALEFNLSHTRGLAVCAVCLGQEVGVDTEANERVSDYPGLARRFFSPAEATALESLPSEQQPAVFFRFWTLKEAFIKALGMGLSMPLDRFAFTLEPDGSPTISFSPGVAQTPEDWQFGELRLPDRFQIALAVRMPVAQPMRILVRETLPLRWQDPGRLLAENEWNRWSIP